MNDKWYWKFPSRQIAARKLRGMVVSMLEDRVDLRSNESMSADWPELRRLGSEACGDGKFFQGILTADVTPGDDKLRRALGHFGRSIENIARYRETEALTYLPDFNLRSLGDAANLNRKQNFPVESSLVCEYDDLSEPLNPEGETMGHIQARPVLAERQVPSDLLKPLPTNAEPALMWVRSDALSPDYVAGDRILVDAAVHAISPGGGDYVLYISGQFTVMRCQLIILRGGNVVRMKPTNPNFDPQDIPEDMVIVSGLIYGKVPRTLDEEKS